jgi:hypothetical protein
MNAYLVKIVERAYSSGAEHWYERTFMSLEGVSKYLQEYLKDIATDFDFPDDWDADDMGCEFPSDDIFTVEKIQGHLINEKRNMGYDTPIWGPESQFECQRPREIFVKPTQVWP